MNRYDYISGLWPDERARQLYLPQEVARGLSFLTLHEMAQVHELCPLRMGERPLLAEGCPAKSGEKSARCLRCRTAFLQGERGGKTEAKVADDVRQAEKKGVAKCQGSSPAGRKENAGSGM